MRLHFEFGFHVSRLSEEYYGGTDEFVGQLNRYLADILGNTSYKVVLTSSDIPIFRNKGYIESDLTSVDDIDNAFNVMHMYLMFSHELAAHDICTAERVRYDF
ncbi:hypothetical protein ABGV42_01155 [Paenibacillus pabuli]|uniref:hypothetical protein n=1 Tax=Paenibacillus pabuli TaxID=1472 RepID=UPI003242E2A3